jgi:glycosyltransferase involved in cell wall biosynthesis
MSELLKAKKKIYWITPDYFLCADAFIVPHLSKEYEIEWILINTLNTKRKSDGLLFGSFKPKEYNLKYRQKDPRIILQYFKLLKKIRQSESDLIYISFHGLPYFFPIFFLLINPNNVIYGAHNVSTPKGASNERLMRIYHAYVFKRIRYFHVFSNYQLNIIRQLLPGKKHYYAPLALENYGESDVTPSNKIIRFLFFGYIREYKRLDLLINSFLDLRKSGLHNIELYIAGNCDNWQYYKSLITNNEGINVRIEIIPNEDIPDLVSSCHYMVLPYQDGAQSAVLTLAYQYNKPVIASYIDSFKQFVVEGSTGFFFKSQSQESLTSVMKNVILNHDTIYERLKINISVFVKKEFSINEI